MLGRFRNRRLELRRDSRGATASEYAIIGALIGIGLIGALVGTKTSLQSIFGTAATQMASSQATAAAAPTGPVYNPNNARSPYWAGKTVASGPIHTSNTNADYWQTTFTDGSKVIVSAYNFTPVVSVRTFDTSTLYTVETGFYKGAIDSTTSIRYTDASFANQAYFYYSSSFDQNANPTAMSAGPCSNNSCSGTSTTVTALFRQQVQNGINDLAIWSSPTNEPL